MGDYEVTLDNQQLAKIAARYKKASIWAWGNLNIDELESIVACHHDVPVLIKEIYALQDSLAECEAALRETGNLVLDFQA